MAITIPNTFVAGTKIEAAPVNANFAEVANAVDKRGDTLTGNLSANAGVTVDGVDLSTIPNTAGTFNPLFPQVVIGTADTNGIRLDLESGTLAVREGDDSAYGPLTSGLLTTSGNHVPATNDGGALGTTSLSWADLFLASGGVINFNNGDVTITHATNQLTFAGADHATAPYTFSGTTNGYLFNVNNVNTGKAAIAFKTNGTTIGVIGLTGSYTGDASTNMAVFAETGYDFRVATNGSTTTKFMVDTSGNVGIGVTPSAWGSTFRAMQIGTGAFISGQTSGSQDTLHIGANFFWDGSNWKYIGSLAATQIRTSGGALTIATAPSGTAGNNITFTDRFRVLEGGNIAIGATARLYLDGVAGTGDTYLHEQASNRAALVVGGTERFVVQAAGVESYGTIGIGYFANGSGTSTGTAVVRNSGDAYLYLQSSSRRFKENIAPAVVTDAQLDAFMATAPSWWDYKGQKNGALGFIAEDLAALPMERYGFNPLVNYDGDGQIESNRDYALIAMHHLVIQRLERKIAALEARIH